MINYFFSPIAYLTDNTVYFNPVFTMTKQMCRHWYQITLWYMTQTLKSIK